MSDEAEDKLGYGKIFVFWFPLALTWIMMAAEGPFLAALVARLPDSTINLAAHGVTFAIAVIIEAPIIMIMSASTALAKDKVAFIRLRNFNYFMCAILTVLMLVLLATPGMSWVTSSLIELPQRVSSLTVTSLTILIPWPAAIGYRRFYQGILIAAGKTRMVAYGTVVRLVAMVAVSMGLFLFSEIEGAYVSAWAMSVGVVLEAVVTRLMASASVGKVLAISSVGKPLTYRSIISFYYPLALTTTITLAVQPMVSFFLGHSRMSLESLAVMPVMGALVFLFRSVGHSFLEVGIALLGDGNKHRKELRNFAIVLSLGASFVLALIAYTPLSVFWFGGVSGLSPVLTDLAKTPICIMAMVPGFAVWLSYQRAILIKAERTLHVTISTLLEATVTIIILIVGIYIFDMVGIVVAAIALASARFFGNLYLIKPSISA